MFPYIYQKISIMAYIPKYEVGAQDIAMDSFRSAWKHNSGMIRVTDDGMTMYMKLPNNDKMAAAALLEANAIISSNRLPLQVDVLESSVSGLVYDRRLVVQFDRTKEPLPCY